jgi:hypothetical protein
LLVQRIQSVVVTDGLADVVGQPPVLRQQAADHGVIGGQGGLLAVSEGIVGVVVGFFENALVLGKAAKQNDNAAVAEQAEGVGVIGADAWADDLLRQPAGEGGDFG